MKWIKGDPSKACWCLVTAELENGIRFTEHLWYNPSSHSQYYTGVTGMMKPFGTKVVAHMPMPPPYVEDLLEEASQELSNV